MQKFVYKAWNAKFQVISGSLEAENIEVAKENIKSKGLKIVELKEKISVKEFLNKPKPLNEAKVANFCGQMATVINAGLTLLKGLEVMREQDKNLNRITSDMLKIISRGETLGNAMKEIKVFPTLLTDMVSAGELSGNVDEIFYEMEAYYEREAAIKSKIKSASIYPAILLGITFLMLISFSTYIFPKFMDIYGDNNDLPGITLFVFGIMNFINRHYILIPVFVVLMIVILKYIFKYPKIGFYVDKVALKLPVYGKLKKDVITNRFAKTMCIFIKSAVPLLSAFDSIKQIIGNSYVANLIENVKNDIINGQKIADAIEKYKVFDLVVIQMFRIGEETGQLENMLKKISDVYDKKIEININRIMALMEPVFTLIIGAIIGITVLAIALPIFKMSELVNK